MQINRFYQLLDTSLPVDCMTTCSFRCQPDVRCPTSKLLIELGVMEPTCSRMLLFAFSVHTYISFSTAVVTYSSTVELVREVLAGTLRATK